MPWFGYWGTDAAFWWILPLVGLLFMGIMLFVCFRGFGCMRGRGRWHSPGDLSSIQREVERLKEDVRRLSRNPG